MTDTSTLGRMRYHPPVTPLELARRALRVIDDSGRITNGGFMWEFGDPVANVRNCVGGAWETFGRATVEAAAAQVAPGICRFCLATADARRRNEPVPLLTEATKLLLRPHAHHRRETIVAGAGVGGNLRLGKDHYAVGTYEATIKGGRLGLGKLVHDGPPPTRENLDPTKHFVRVWDDGSVNVVHTAACALQPDRCPLDAANLVVESQIPGSAPSTSARRREVSTAFTASASANLAARVRGGPPTPVRPLTASARNVAAMKRMGVDPATYFGPDFTTQEQDAALGAFIRRTYPGRKRRAG